MSVPAVKEEKQPARLRALLEELREAAAFGNKEAAFAVAFFTGPTARNAAASYRAIHPTGEIEKESAWVLGHRYKTDDKVKRYLSELSQATGLTRDLIEEQVSALAASDASELSGVKDLADLAGCAPHVRAAVRKIKKTVRTRGRGDDATVEEVTEIELHDKNHALRLGADILGLTKDQENRGVTVNFNFGNLTLDEYPEGSAPIDVTPE